MCALPINNRFFHQRIQERNIDPTIPVDLVAAKLKKQHPHLIEKFGETGLQYTPEEIVEEPRIAKKLLWTLHRSDDQYCKILQNVRDELFKERKEAFLSISNQDKSHTPVIVFVAMSASFMIVRESIALRKKGYQTCLLTIHPIYANLRNQFDEAFDATLDGFESIESIVDIVKASKPSAFHILCCMFEYHLTPVVIENSGDTSCICEFYDITSPYLSEDKLPLLLPKTDNAQAIVKLDLEMENYIFNKADGIVSRLTSDLINKIKKHHDSNLDVLQFNAYPLPQFQAKQTKKYSTETGRYHLVHAGNVHPNTIPKEVSPIGLMAETFKNIIDQGISIDVLQDPNRPITETDPDYAHFFELTKSPLFNFRRGVAPNKLAEVLSRYDYGLNLSDFDPAAAINLKECMRGGIGTKQFTYAEASLPCIICAEYEYATQHLMTHGYGIAVDEHGRKNMKKHLDEVDYQALLKNISSFNRNYNMLDMVDELIDFYNSTSLKGKIGLVNKVTYSSTEHQNL